MSKHGEAHSEVGRVQKVRKRQITKMDGVIGAGSLAPSTTKDALKAFLLVLSDTENGIIPEIQALKSCISCDQELNGGDHAGVGDEIEEAGNVLLIEYKVIRGVVVLISSKCDEGGVGRRKVLSVQGKQLAEGSKWRKLLHILSACRTQSDALCSSLENVLGGCRQRGDGDPSVGPIDNVEEGEVAICHEGES